MKLPVLWARCLLFHFFILLIIFGSRETKFTVGLGDSDNTLEGEPTVGNQLFPRASMLHKSITAI